MESLAITSVEGLDQAEALARLGGNIPVYLKMLRRFLQLSDVPEQIAHHIGVGELTVAERLAHTLKGVAASLGATQLQRQAAELERELARQVCPEPLLSQLRAELLRLHNLIAPALLPQPATQRGGPGGTSLREWAATMATFLQNFDAQAVELLESQPQAFAQLMGPNFSAFEQSVGNFAFDQALALLQQVDLDQEEF